jgi:hypothetical protein
MVALFGYMAAGLSEPGAPSMPLETAFDGMWETAFGAFCANLARSVTALATEHAAVTAERIDFVGDAIIAATAPLFENLEQGRRAARAAIQADGEWRAGREDEMVSVL